MITRNMWQLFTSAAATYPNEPALIAGDTKLTYHELQQEVYFYADFLHKQGVTYGDCVAVLLPRDHRLVVALLAILSCGAVYIPLDYRYPHQRRQAVLADSGCKFFITEENHDDTSVKIISAPHGEKLESLPISTKVNSTDLAYIIYTSGSTGTPKGVMISHGNAAAMIAWALSVYSREELSFTLAVTSICFDLSVFEIFVPLSAGTCVVLVDHALSLIDHPIQHSLTLINTVPSVIETLARANAIPDSVKTINLAGEALQQSLVNILYNKQIERVYNLYGPTETTTYSTYYLAEKNADRVMVPIGKAITGTQIFLLDQHQQPVPKLVRGEIYIAGAGVTQGYCGRPEENQERFIELEINGKKTRLYRTGDLARINAEQELEYLGRQDQQIKIRGFRVEPGEVAHVLKQYPDVQQAYVMTHPEVDDGQQLMAYVVAKDQLDLDTSRLLLWLGKQLPDYMVPHYFMQLPALPVNVNGKIDRAQLPLPNRKEALACDTHTEIETSLAQLWQSLLAKSAFQRDDNFFYVGGHSLLAARLQAKIQEVFKVEFKLEEIFEYPSIVEQASVIHDRQTKHVNVPQTFERLERPKEIPLSFSQQRLWYLQYAEEATPISNIPITIMVQGELDVAALTQAFKQIIQRHEILRTTYHSINYHLVQVIHDHVDFAITITHCTADELPGLLFAEANRKFDLSCDLMVRATLFKVSDGQQILMVTQHHIASDAWSLNVLMRELSALYQAYHRGSSLPSLPAPIQYADYSCWQRFHLNEKMLRLDMDFWKKKLDNAPDTIKLPYDMPRSEQQTYHGEFYQWELPADLVAQLKHVANRNQSTLFMVLLTAFNVLLYRYTQQKDFCVGILSANRPFSELEHTLGFFVNTLVIRSQVDSGITSRKLLRDVRQNVLECLAHQQLPFDKLVESLRPNRQPNRHPFFQVLFSLQNALENDLELDGLTLEAREFDRHIAKFDLTLSLVEKPHGLSAIFEFNRDLFYRETIARMTAHYIQILKAMAANLDGAISDIDLLTSAERQKWLIELNAVNHAYPEQSSLAELFAESVKHHAAKVAVIAGDKRYTYAELDCWSSQLANLLKEYGVGPTSHVGLLLPRSIETIVSMLAVIKTGACYVPLDPAAPTERLDYILQDANISLVVSMQGCTDHLPSSANLQTIILETAAEKIAQQSVAAPQVSVTPTSSCYIMYTSGSTGKPKGVIAKHQGVVRLVKNTNYVRLDDQQVLLQVSQLVFDGATFDIWGSLLNAATLVLMPDGLPELNKLAELINEHSVTTLFVTTQLFNTLVDYKLPMLSPLRQVLFGGDVASIYHVEQFKQAYPHCALSNIYGPTECTTYALSYPIPDSFDRTRSLPLGTPIANTSVVILSEDMQVVPVNVPGEICLGGPGLARGYLNQPELTREKFIRNPISELSSEYLYRTGDVGAYRADGQIAFLGRVDDQIKLRGYRIELPEIEQAIRHLPSVIDAVVIVQKPEDLLVAYVIATPGVVPTLQAVRQSLASHLPSYMLPDAVTILNEYPLTTTGKIDKLRLPKHQFNRRMAAAGAAVDNSIAKVIYDIWVEVLNDEEVTYEDNFFEIGGNSLKIVHILDQLQSHFASDKQVLAKLDITTLFQYPTITALANYLTSSDETAEDEAHTRQSINRRDKRKEASQ